MSDSTNNDELNDVQESPEKEPKIGKLKSSTYARRNTQASRRFSQPLNFSPKHYADHGPRNDVKMSRASSFKKSRSSSRRDYDPSYTRKKYLDYDPSDDARISKTLRRIVREDNQENFKSLCTQLQESFIAPENQRYIRKAMEFICESLFDAIHSCSAMEMQMNAAECLAHLALALKDDVGGLLDWVFVKYADERNPDVRYMLLHSIFYTLQIDTEHSIGEFAGELVHHMQGVLETAESSRLVFLIGKIFLILMETYIESFSEHFKDVVDIIVGWHIDVDQSTAVIRTMASCVQALSPYWSSDIAFTLCLTSQILEDVYQFAQEYHQLMFDYTTDASALIDAMRCSDKMTLLLKVYNSITRSALPYLNPLNSPLVPWNFIFESLGKVVASLLICVKFNDVDEEIMITGNECIWLLVSVLQNKLIVDQDLCDYMYAQLENTPNYKDFTTASLLQLIAKVVKEGSANLPETIIRRLIGPNSYLLTLRFSNNIDVHNGVVAVYHSLLNLKNIPLLQEAYKYVLCDLDKAYLVLDVTAPSFCIEGLECENQIRYNNETAEAVVLFHLKALSDLANAGGSIIGIWVLQPCIFELLAIKLRPVHMQVSYIRFGILYLLYSHCLRYSNFISSSELVASINGKPNVSGILRMIGSDEMSPTSPTSGHLMIILDLLCQLLNLSLDMECSLLILRWCSDLLAMTKIYVSGYLATREFSHLLDRMITFAYKTAYPEIVESVMINLITFLQVSSNWSAKPQLLENIVELCFIQINTVSYKVREKCREMILFIPWSIVINKIRKLSKGEDGTFSQHLAACKSHMCRGTNGEIQSQHFNLFISYVLDGIADEDEKLFLKSFYNCWNSELKTEFGSLVPKYESSLMFWQSWESAKHCVTNKLRTSLGKPQDTFMAIETALKKLAREATKKSSENVDEFTIQRVRLLLEFVEQLEKCIYNAINGTAVALTAASKTVRTFFSTNKTTCTEWLARVRIYLVTISIHCGLPTSAIRHGYAALQDIVNADKVESVEFQNMVNYVAFAYYNLQESDAIEGLRTWCKRTFKISFFYLEPLTDQAANRHENALKGYLNIVNEAMLDASVSETPELSLDESLKDDPLPDMTRTFIADQITECYLDLYDWVQLKQWKEKEADFLSTANGSTLSRYVSHITVKEVDMLSKMESGDTDAARQLMEWDLSSTNLNDGSNLGWNVKQVLYQAKEVLLEKFTGSTDDDSVNTDNEYVVEEYLNSLFHFISEDLRSLPSPEIEKLFMLVYISASYFSDSVVASDNFTWEINKTKLESKYLNEALNWTRIIEKYRNRRYNMDVKIDTSNLKLQLSKSARKEGNYGLASKQLLSYFEDQLNIPELLETSDVPSKHFEILLDSIRQSSPSVWCVDNAAAIYELTKLTYEHVGEELAIDICGTMVTGLTELGQKDPEVRTKSAKYLLQLAKWLSIDNRSNKGSDTNSKSFESIEKLSSWFAQSGSITDCACDVLSYDFRNSTIPEVDATVGSLLQLSVAQNTSSARAWNQFGGWCYRWGRVVADEQRTNALTESDKTYVASYMPSSVCANDVHAILARIKPFVDDNDIEADNVNTTELIEWQLRSIGQFTDDQISGLIEFWKSTHQRIYAYYHLAAQAYFKFLQLNDDSKGGAEAVTATLRLLRLIVKYALELQSVLEVQLLYTPTKPWKCIIPQLFSRLNHPEPYVRRRISELLSRLAEDSPHLITFPAVVGSDSGATGTIKNMPTSKLFKPCVTNDVDPAAITEEEEIEEEDDDDFNQDDQGRTLENCYLAMVNTLAKKVPETIIQVQLLVSEMRRITLLWDELWLGALTQHYSDMARRINQLEMEIARVDSNTHLTDEEKDSLVIEKNTVLLKPLLFIMEQLQAITSVKPETPHEEMFQETYGEFIATTIAALRSPRDPRRPVLVWKAIKDLHSQFQRRMTRRSAYTLRMADVSPVLAAWHGTGVAMPGMERVTVKAVLDHIAVLPTKTKPKKLAFRGSDGKTYNYLFKGLEDLHLDERIMQFLSIANTMLKENGYQARHYSVIPLGPRSGLISWVEHVTPVFAVYKRWQQREAAANSQGAVKRPSELFYDKLSPLLKEHGINSLNNRKEWPASVMIQVLKSLMDETPSNLLANELWCQSINTGAWWKIVRLYSTSLAVMSVIGYVIGLGDRHLDNVLVEFRTGEVVHIDYNVCFEKGKTLRIPEKVPFRMTPNFKTALGPTGVEGIFRKTCERVLKVMKIGKETLLTLLEAFVYDPLIDWTPGIETGYTGAVYGGGRAIALKNKLERKQLEQEVTASMFFIRLREIKYDWFDNKSNLETALNNLESNLKAWLEAEEKLSTLMDSLAKHTQLLELLKAVAANPQHSLYTLYGRYQSHKDATQSMISAQVCLKEKLEECEAQLTKFEALFFHLREEQLTQWMLDVNNNSSRETKICTLITDFLVNTGQSQLVQQCSTARDELKQHIINRIPLAIKCLEKLKQYSTVSSLYPASVSYSHRYAACERWIRTMLEFPSVATCDTVITEYDILFKFPWENDTLRNRCTKFAKLLGQSIEETESAVAALKVKSAEMTCNDDIEQLEQTLDKIADTSTEAMRFAVLQELCQLARRFFKLENAGMGAGDLLMVLTNLEGEWFLDDMCLMTEISIKLVSYILSSSLLEENPSIHLVTKCLDSLHGIYKRLQELNLNFMTIIMPETMKKLLSEEKSVLEMISNLDLIIKSCDLSLVDLIKELQTHLRYTIMGMVPPNPNCMSIANDLRLKFNMLLRDRADNITNRVTEGQMLLMGFNVLFSNVFSSTLDLFALLPSLTLTNTAWNSVDLLKETRSLIGPVFSSESQMILQDILFVKYIHTMHQFFCDCQITALAYRGDPNVPITYHADEQLGKLIKRFTADYLSSQLLGLFSYTLATAIGLFLQHMGFNLIAEIEQRDIGAESKVPLDELCKKAINEQCKLESISMSNYSQAVSVLSNLQLSWKQLTIQKRIQREIQMKASALKFLKQQYTTHRWIHDQMLDISSPIPTIDRTKFLEELKSDLSELADLQTKVNNSKEQYDLYVKNVRSRLKWAAGANASLAEAMNNFEEKMSTEMENYSHSNQLVTTVMDICSSVLCYESLRLPSNESTIYDAEFIQLVKNYKEACVLVINLAAATLSPEEEVLIKILPPTGSIDNDWVENADSLVSKSIKDLGLELEPLKSSKSSVYDDINLSATVVRQLTLEHNKILVDVRTLLKSMTKFEENSGLTGIPDYLARHKAFYNQLNVITKECLTSEFTMWKGQTLFKQTSLLKLQIDYIYEELMKFSVEKIPSKFKRPPFLRQEMIHLTPRKKITRDNRTGKGVQEKNEYAVNVWRRVRMKLEGCDSDNDPKCRLTTQDQIDKIIRDATDMENLALLYEGWTPWV